MIKDTDDKKIIFDKNKKFNTNNYEIRNQVNNREIQLNDETVLHACISDITFEDDKITINFLSKDDLEFTYEISKEAETGEIPDYLQINETDIVQLAIKIFTLEAYKVFMNDTTLPEATAINELQATITKLEKDLDDAGDTITTLTGQINQLTPPDNHMTMDCYVDFNDITFDSAFSGSVANDYLAGGTVKILISTDHLTGFDVTNSTCRTAVLNNMTINNLKINDTTISISSQSVSSQSDDISVTLIFNISPISDPTVAALENNTISVDITNNNTNYTYTVEGTFTINGNTIGSITTIADE